MEYMEIPALRMLTDWITVVYASISRQNRDFHFLATVAQLAVVGAGPSALTPTGTVYAAGKLIQFLTPGDGRMRLSSLAWFEVRSLWIPVECAR